MTVMPASRMSVASSSTGSMRKTCVVPLRRMWIRRGHAPPRDEGELVDGLLVGVDEVGAGRLQSLDPVEMKRLREGDGAMVGAGGHELPPAGICPRVCQKSAADRT